NLSFQRTSAIPASGALACHLSASSPPGHFRVKRKPGLSRGLAGWLVFQLPIVFLRVSLQGSTPHADRPASHRSDRPTARELAAPPARLAGSLDDSPADFMQPLLPAQPVPTPPPAGALIVCPPAAAAGSRTGTAPGRWIRSRQGR